MIFDTAALSEPSTEQYARCIEASKRVRWDIERDVMRGRGLDFGKHFLPDGLSRVARLECLPSSEQRLLSQVQGRTYANMFGLVERFIGAKMLEISRNHWFGDQVALEALVRFTDEELKHQALFRRLEQMIAAGMPPGYEFVPEPNDVATAVMAAPTWSVLALTCHIELFTQVHYRHSLEPDAQICELFKDVFLFHWKEESQHAVLDELEWAREDARLSGAERDAAVDGLMALLAAVDGIVVAQAKADARYFARLCGRSFQAAESERIGTTLLDAYRWQYIVSGARNPRFRQALDSKLQPEQRQRIQSALAALLG